MQKTNQINKTDQKRIQKIKSIKTRAILLSLLSLMMIATIANAVGLAPTEQIQNDQIAALENNDTIQDNTISNISSYQQTNDTEQQILIDNVLNNLNIVKDNIDTIQNNISTNNGQIIQLQTTTQNLDTRVTNLETNQTNLTSQVNQLQQNQLNQSINQSKTIIFGKSNVSGSISASPNWAEIANFTFYLPEDSNVYIEISGAFRGANNDFLMNMDVDKEPCSSSNYPFDCITPNLKEYYQPGNYAGFQNSNTYFLTKGTHTVYLQGNTIYSYPDYRYPTAEIRPINFNIIATTT